MASDFTGRRFGIHAAVGFGVWFAIVWGLPALIGSDLVWPIKKEADPSRSLNVPVTTVVATLTHLLLVTLLVVPVWRRMRALGLPVWLGLFVPLMLLADLPFVFSLDPRLTFARSFSSQSGQIPLFFATSAAAVIALAIRQARPNRRPVRYLALDLATVATGVWLVAYILAFVGMANGLKVVEKISASGEEPTLFFDLYFVLVPLLYWASILSPYICVAFGVSSLVGAIMSRQGRTVVPA